MIEQLMVKDYILFDSCLIDFQNGMSVITGETGAGKSLLIDAIDLLCGNRVIGNVVRKGKDRAILQMVLSSNPQADALLEEAGIDVEDSIIISRTITSNHKSTVRINQQITTLAFVKKLTSLLIDIHSQMDTYHLMDPKVQTDLLDSYAKNDTLKNNVNEAFRRYSHIHNELEKLKNEEFSDAELDFLTSQLNEIDEADVKEDELDQLKEDIEVAGSWQKNKDEVNALIYSLNCENGILDSIYSFNKQIQKMNLLNDIDLDSMYYQFKEIDDHLKQLRDQYGDGNYDLDALQEREYKIKRLYRKYGGSFVSLMENKDKIISKIDRIIHRQDVFDRLEKEENQAYEEYTGLAKQLHDSRLNVCEELENLVMKHCHDLMLEKARFKICFSDKKPSLDGMDQIDFMVSMNPGQDYSLLKDSASGGELSRLMLALKVVFQAQSGIETIIFDEIDTGVSGKVALSMGNKMHVLAEEYQVLCITHLASVAVYADMHYMVKKTNADEDTITQVQELDHNSILSELAVMSHGSITDASISSMKELWDQVHG